MCLISYFEWLLQSRHRSLNMIYENPEISRVGASYTFGYDRTLQQTMDITVNPDSECTYRTWKKTVVNHRSFPLKSTIRKYHYCRPLYLTLSVSKAVFAHSTTYYKVSYVIYLICIGNKMLVMRYNMV